MAESYCGKCCTQCERRIQAKCPGCRVGPGKRYGTECGIAKCCTGRALSNCEQCKSVGSCALLERKNFAPGIRTQHQVEDEAELRRKFRDCSLLGKWLMILFWVTICSIVVNVLFRFRLSGDPVRVVSDAVVLLVNSIIFLRLSSASRRFRSAGVLGLVSLALSLAGLLVRDPTAVMIVSLLALVVSMVAEYQQFMALMDTAALLDQDLAVKWGNLWVAYFICLCATALGLLLTVVGTVLAFLASLMAAAGAIGTLVVTVFRIVYLYTSCLKFRGYANNVQELV